MSKENREVTIVDCSERVALELMQMILRQSAEAERTILKEKDLRDMYIRCRLAVLGHDAER